METEAHPRSPAPTRAWRPIPGPVDREHFLDAQRRNRRATWRLSAISALVVAALGLVTSLVLVPAAIFELRILLGLLGVVLSPARVLGEAAEWYLTLFIPHTDEPRSQLQLIVGSVAWVVPGVVALMGSWLGLRRLFRGAGIGGALLTLGAREPRPDDLEERQLVNVVEEMALAAGIEPPRVMLLAADLPNAAALGTGPGDATVVISRRLLDEMDRDETQGIIGHLVASIGNGDLAVIWTILSVFQTFGALFLILDLPFSATSRESAARLFRFCYGRRDDPGRAAEADILAMRLAQQLRPEGMDDVIEFMAAIERKDIGRARRVFYYIRAIVLMPLLLGIVIVRSLLGFATLFLLGWLLAFTWRTRRYLADATAVQLTRYPDGLARALATLGKIGSVAPQARAFDFLFIVGEEAAMVRAGVHAMGEVQQELARLREGGEEEAKSRALVDHGAVPVPFIPEHLGTAVRIFGEYVQALDEAEEGSFAKTQGIVARFHPPLERRSRRLQKLGATIQRE